MDALASSSDWTEIAAGAWKLRQPPGPLFQYDDPVGFEWNRYRLRIDSLPAELNGLRIVHVSDTHCKPLWKRAYDDLNDRLAANPPDLLLFTGDLVDDRRRPGRAVAIAKRLVSDWHARMGAFGIRGNHDLSLPLARFAGSRLRNIEGQHVVLQRGGAEIELVGLPGPDRVDLPASFPASIPPRRVGVPRIVLSHFPDHVRRCGPMHADIFLAGHTHGGQCSLPGIVPIIRHDSLLWRYGRGVHRFGSQWLVVNRGLGFTQLPIRVFCSAEVIELNLLAGG